MRQSNFNDTLVEAWNDFKGSAQNSSKIAAQNVLDAVETSRTTTWQSVDSVSVYLKDDVEELPDAIQDIIDRHNLVQIGLRGAMANSKKLRILYFTTEEIATLNNVAQIDPIEIENKG